MYSALFLSNFQFKAYASFVNRRLQRVVASVPSRRPWPEAPYSLFALVIVIDFRPKHGHKKKHPDKARGRRIER